MTPDIRQLRYFIAVAEELHFSRAARRLNMAQPPLSQQIQQLELVLGTSLFVRTTRRVELTPAGRVFLDGARRTLAEAEAAVERTRRVSRGELETLRVGYTDASAMSVLPDTIGTFRRQFPLVHLELSEQDGSAGQVEAVQQRTVDVALIRGPVDAGDLEVDVLLSERFCLMVPATHPFARRSRVPLKLVKGEPLVHFPRRLSPAYYDLLLGMCHDAGFSPNVAVETVRYPAALSLVASGMGMAFVPKSNRVLTHTGVRYCELSGATARAQIVAVYRSDRRSIALTGLLKAASATE